MSDEDMARSELTRYLILNYSEDELHAMAATADSREDAVLGIVPEHVTDATDDQRLLFGCFVRLSPHLSCWRSLVREVLADRQRQADQALA